MSIKPTAQLKAERMAERIKLDRGVPLVIQSQPASKWFIQLSVALGVALALLGPFSAAMARDLPDFTELVERHSPAVVNISTVQSREQPSQSTRPGVPQGDLEEFFRRFLPDGAPRGRGGQPRPPQSLGSGFIVSADGYILTNNHVIEDADKIVVRLTDRRELDAELIGADARSDLAVIKVEAKNLPVVKLGNSERLKVGEWVLAIGSPFGFDASVTAGIVSAKGRSLPTEQGENYVPFIQSDVAINPGNSGGPLFNLAGEVVGINSQIYTRSGGFMGVSFSIPIDVAMDVADQLKKDGRVSRGWLGVVIQDVSRDLAESFNLKKPGGALVAGVSADGPAGKAGVLEGDIITKFNGKTVDLSADLPHLVGRARAGSNATLTVVRAGKTRRIKVRIGELADRGSQQIGALVPQTTEPSRLGLVVEDLVEEERARLGIEAGVRVVSSEGAAADASIAAGDVITMLDNKSVDTVAKFDQIADGLAAGKPVPVLTLRNGSKSFRALRVPK